jgi:hypothetical protein
LRAKAILWGKRKTFDNRKKEENAPLMCIATGQSFF